MASQRTGEKAATAEYVHVALGARRVQGVRVPVRQHVVHVRGANAALRARVPRRRGQNEAHVAQHLALGPLVCGGRVE